MGLAAGSFTDARFALTSGAAGGDEAWGFAAAAGGEEAGAAMGGAAMAGSMDREDGCFAASMGREDGCFAASMGRDDGCFAASSTRSKAGAGCGGAGCGGALAPGASGAFGASAVGGSPSGRLSVSGSAMFRAINRLPERLLGDHYSLRKSRELPCPDGARAAGGP